MSLDEDLRAEERRTRAGLPSRRRLVELSRLASALEAAAPEIGELLFHEGHVPRSVRTLLDVGTWAAVREVLRRPDMSLPAPSRPATTREIREWVTPDPVPYYGPPAWLAAAEAVADRIDNETFLDITRSHGRTQALLRTTKRFAPPSRDLLARSRRYADRHHSPEAVAFPWRSGTVLPRSAVSDPLSAPEATRRALNDALTTLPARPRERRPAKGSRA